MSKPTNSVTFTPEALKAVLDQAIAEALAAHDAKPRRTLPAESKSASSADKTDRSLQLDIAVVRAFKKAGFGDVTPRVDVQTYNRWASQGLKVKTGERSLRIKQFRLFHKSQVEPISPPSKTEMRTAGEAAVASKAPANPRTKKADLFSPTQPEA